MNAPLSKGNGALLRSFTFSLYTTVAVITSYFPLYFLSKGYSTLQIGLLYSVGPMIGIVSNLFWGVMSDKWQTVKKILIVVLIGQFLTAAFIFRADAFGLLMVLMGLFFFFQSPMSSLNDSQILLTIKNTGKSYASIRVWGSIGFAVASLVFGMLLKEFGVDLTASLIVATIGCSLLLSFRLKDARQTGYKKPDFSGLVPIITSRSFLAFLLAVLVVSVAHRFNDGFLALYLQSLGADQTIVGWSWLASAVSEIPIFFWLSKHGHKYKELPLLVLCCFVYVARFFLMSIVDNPLWVIAIQSMHSISFGIFLFTVIRYIQNVVPDQFRASGQAVFAITWSGLAGLISGALGGWVFNSWGPHAMYTLASALAFVAMLGFLALHLRTRGRTALHDLDKSSS
ncbi:MULTISPECIES: MFS transporter [unclassified Paenibacillus]|uniref:MFS transporter n=1 Tax=unclassified Paenibacillus TaxID=185978 RepID=UPI001AE93B2C|nr:MULTISPECIES: MFS transporter [unclassified Paenibacillus]MBP1154748.1 PPP family 3-phenylpropionic acid transporter [Paenibacillus sp. PvP091]MBP1169868.1 PPP family 3-phenylpropionic acid transporter [Paenibacillus sp. PvR098]MBP2440896.1 PPP family 3-phenylpropionic acid transporter [Paenibacillus sp. PvP052]